MTMICLFIVSLFASIVHGANYVYCGTNNVAQGSPRPLPVQGLSLTTGNVVVGLPARSRIEIADCGWYEYKPTPAPATQSNEYYRISSIVRDGLFAMPQYKAHYKPVKPVEYSKRLLYRELLKIGAWTSVKAFLEANNLWEDFALATTLESDDELLKKALEALPAQTGIDADALTEILKRCVAK